VCVPRAKAAVLMKAGSKSVASKPYHHIIHFNYIFFLAL
jgi:hypothetical protein